ncbi:MAG: hypothetical protein JST81_01565 [Bacteroidetes bacterium]|nr:hypothetical protein [Bacteroidota bacterium]
MRRLMKKQKAGPGLTDPALIHLNNYYGCGGAGGGGGKGGNFGFGGCGGLGGFGG